MKIVEKDRVLKTEDYSLFKVNDDYKFSNKKLESLEIEISVKNLCEDLPILIDENFNILDGKYKFEACKKLKLPIYYKVVKVSNKLDLLKAKEISFKPTIHDYLITHSDKLCYRKILEWKSTLKCPYSQIIQAIIGFEYKQNHGNHKDTIRFKNGFLEYEPKFDFIFKKLVEFRDKFVLNFGDLNYKIDDAHYFIEHKDYNVDTAISAIKETKCIENFLHLAKEGHPHIKDIFTFMDEIDLLYCNEEYNIDSKETKYDFGRKESPYSYEVYQFPNLRLIESYLGKKIFIK